MVGSDFFRRDSFCIFCFASPVFLRLRPRLYGRGAMTTETISEPPARSYRGFLKSFPKNRRRSIHEYRHCN